MRICPDCNKTVAPRDAILIKGKAYHKSCRICSHCGRPIEDSPESFLGSIYHSFCTVYALKPCCVCGNIPNRMRVNYWHEIACENHADTCCYCGHFLSPSTHSGHSFARDYLDDEEIKSKECHICGNCESTIVKTDQDVERCRKEVLDIFRSHKITGIPDDVPIILSDMRDESKKMGMMLAGLHHAVISTSRSRYSFSITMDDGMPEMNFKGVLGHELLHSWLRLYAIELPKHECEGFCNLGEELILKTIGTPESKYWTKRCLEDNDDPIYGDGYRLMKKRLDKLGWEGLMHAVRWENKTRENIQL